MAKTLVEKLTSPTRDVSIFKISGVLGYHENTVLERFFGECGKKNIQRLIIDLSNLGSLGGGCARIIRNAAGGGSIAVCIVGASATVRNFLENKGKTQIIYLDSHEEALEKIASLSPPGNAGAKAPDPEPAAEADPVLEKTVATIVETPDGGAPRDADAEDEDDVIVGVEASEDDESSQVDPDANKSETDEAASADPGRSPSEEKAKPQKSGASVESVQGPSSTDSGDAAPAGPTSAPISSPNRELERKIVQYRALFSVNADFNRIHEKSRLLDAFLLTAIAQVGVESAAFLEFRTNAFVAAAWKGFETADPESLSIARDDVDLDLWFNNTVIFSIKDSPLSDKAKKKIDDWGMPYIAPFIVYEEFRGLVLLGNPIRNKLDDDASDYLSMLIKQAAIAYENSCRYEEESQRTLGLVHSLISMIEENTASRGSTEMMVNYTYGVAKALHYPEEHVQDLMYGTVLRDIGMIKVSDLIVRTPRELQDDEWNVIKRHPREGAEMLRRMKFAEHTTKIVLCHHERFNAEGYPGGLQGAQIPLGARIVSVVESYAAMLQDRPTRPALLPEDALNTLRENWGIRYDPDVVKAFVEMVEEEIRTGEKVQYPGGDLFKA